MPQDLNQVPPECYQTHWYSAVSPDIKRQAHHNQKHRSTGPYFCTNICSGTDAFAVPVSVTYSETHLRQNYLKQLLP